MDSIISRFQSRLIDRKGKRHSVPTKIEYWPGDPYSVRITFDPDDHLISVWEVARDLLDDGLCASVEQPAGYGDFRIGVCREDCGTIPVRLGAALDTVHIELENVHDPILSPTILHAPFKPLSDFLIASYALVDAGAESQHIDMEKELANLLA